MVVTINIMQNRKAIDDVSFLLNSLHINYRNIEDYIKAFVHKSIVNERPDFIPEHNERLEFLGDAVLELVITDNLYRDFKEKNEGELTDIRSALVRGKNLALISRKLGLNNYLFLGKGEELGGGRDSDYLLANTLEAFIGALYMDLGIDDAKKFINTHIYTTLDDIIENKYFKDFKSLIQEYVQAEFDITPTYEVLLEEGPDHDKNFKVGVFIGEKQIGEGSGSSKKKAQEDAAKNAYETKDKWN
ncbi:MAG: ribonuclease III [Candidatus Gracilibacteria bacterium]|nr:ribonuclease III [Candidatus Gracilibacteria bacterium]